MRLGFVVKSLARPELRSHDSRRWQSNPHLSVSLAYLHDMLAYLARARIGMYRLASDLAPYATHPDMASFHNQVGECLSELAELGRMARSQSLRLSFHPAQHVVLNSPQPDVVRQSTASIALQAGILNAMEMGREAMVIVHIGGTYGDAAASRARLAELVLALPDQVRARLAVENDDSRFGVVDALWVHQHTGLPVVYDHLHHRLHNPSDISAGEALASCLATWPIEIVPKVHFSSPRTEWLVLPEGSDASPMIRKARWSYHSDFANPFEFVDFLRMAKGLRPFDVMLELRAKDLALTQLRRDLSRFAPDLAANLEPNPEDDTQAS